MSNRFDNQGFIVLGDAVEIKHSIAVAAARQGARVVLGLNRQELTPKVESERISVVTAETAECGIKCLFDKGLAQVADLSTLIHCLSAPALTGQSLIQISRDEWDRMISAYLREPFLSSQRAVQEFLAAGGGGHIIFVLSTVSDSSTSQVGYAVVRSGLYAFIRSIAKEYGRRGIFCNGAALCHENDPQHGPDGCNDATTEAILFLASGEASFVNGEMIPIIDPAPRAA